MYLPYLKNILQNTNIIFLMAKLPYSRVFNIWESLYVFLLHVLNVSTQMRQWEKCYSTCNKGSFSYSVINNIWKSLYIFLLYVLNVSTLVRRWEKRHSTYPNVLFWLSLHMRYKVNLTLIMQFICLKNCYPQRFLKKSSKWVYK